MDIKYTIVSFYIKRPFFQLVTMQKPKSKSIKKIKAWIRKAYPTAFGIKFE